MKCFPRFDRDVKISVQPELGHFKVVQRKQGANRNVSKAFKFLGSFRTQLKKVWSYLNPQPSHFERRKLGGDRVYDAVLEFGSTDQRLYKEPGRRKNGRIEATAHMDTQSFLSHSATSHILPFSI